MKNTILYVAICLFLAQQAYSACDCGQGKVFNGNSETCTDIPKSAGDPGYLANCQDYVTTQIGTVGLNCLKCTPGYEIQIGLGQGGCQSNGIPNCVSTAVTNSGTICDTCSEGMYVSSDSLQCVQNPNNGENGYVQDCKVYFTGNSGIPQCNQCIDGKYLDNSNACANSPLQGEQGYIQNCLVYQNVGGFSCKKCNKSGYLRNGQCVELSSLNCLKADINSCLKCKEGYYEKTVQDDICIQNPQEGDDGYVDNCGRYSHWLSDGLKCDYCISGYYFDDSNGKCNVAEEFFSKCSDLSKGTQGFICSRCIDGYYLGSSTTEVCSQCSSSGPKKTGNSKGSLIQFQLGIIFVILLFIM